MTTEKTEEQIPVPAAETSTKEETKTTGNDKFLQQEPTAENEIHVAAKGHIKNYLGYAFRILNKTNHQQLKIRATGNAIVKANILIELVKRRVGDLHQLNSIYSMVISSHEEKLGEKIETKRRVTAMDTVLSKTPLDPNDPGYQEPAPKDEPYQNASRPGGRPGMKGKDDKRRRGPKLYNAPRGGGDDDDKKRDGRDRQQADRNNDRRGGRGRRDRINMPGVKDDESQSQRRNFRGGYNQDNHYGGRGGYNDSRPRPYNNDRPSFGPRDNQSDRPPYMARGGYNNPRSFDDSRGMRGQRGRYPPRGSYGGGYNDRRPGNDNYQSGPPQYEQQNNYHSNNYRGRGGGGGGYDNYDKSYGPPPERRYPPRGGYNADRYGHGGNDNPRYSESRGPRQPYDSERHNNNDNRDRSEQTPSGQGYRAERTERSERPMGQGPGPMNEDQPGRMMGGPTSTDTRGKHPDGRRYNDHSEMRREDGGDREQERSERPRYNQPRDEGENNFRGGFNPMRGGGSYGGENNFRGGGFRRGGPRGEYRGSFNGGPPRDNDGEGGRSEYRGRGGFHGGYDNFRGGEGGPGMRGVRGNLRGGRGEYRGRGGMYDRRDNDPEGGAPMHRISERRDDDMGRGGRGYDRGMPSYRGRGYGEDSGRPRHMDGGEYRGRGGFMDRGGFNPSHGGDEGRQNHVIKTKTRGGLGASEAPE